VLLGEDSLEIGGRKRRIFHEFLLENLHDFFGIFGLLAEQFYGVNFGPLDFLHHNPEVDGELDLGEAVAIKEAFLVVAE
jgi:hypothetical protein